MGWLQRQPAVIDHRLSENLRSGLLQTKFLNEGLHSPGIGLLTGLSPVQ